MKTIFYLLFSSINLITTASVNEASIATANFPGGPAAFQQFTAEHLVYPTCAREGAVEGVIKVGFTVLEDGSIDRIQILEGLDPACNEAAILFIRSMPDWIPATKFGKHVATKVNLAINFQLET